MKNRLLWIVLIASLAFNLFFAVGSYSRKSCEKTLKTREEKEMEFARKLGMSQEQTERYRKLLESYHVQKQIRSDERRKQYDIFWAEIVKDNPDEKVLDEFVKATSSPERKKDFVKRMQSLMSILSPDQRKQAAEIIRSYYRSRRKRSSGNR